MYNLFVLMDTSLGVAHEWMKMGAALTAVLAAFGASYGISQIARSALEAISRQPEAGEDLRSSMIVSAALIEGVTFFAIVVCLLTLFV